MTSIKNQSDFNTKVKSAGDSLVVVDFYAKWCGPCKMISPKLSELAKYYAKKLVILKVDVDKCDDLSSKYKIGMLPTFLFMKKGKKISQFAGADVEKLEKTIKKNV